MRELGIIFVNCKIVKFSRVSTGILLRERMECLRRVDTEIHINIIFIYEYQRRKNARGV